MTFSQASDQQKWFVEIQMVTRQWFDVHWWQTEILCQLCQTNTNSQSIIHSHALSRYNPSDLYSEHRWLTSSDVVEQTKRTYWPSDKFRPSAWCVPAFIVRSDIEFSDVWILNSVKVSRVKFWCRDKRISSSVLFLPYKHCRTSINRPEAVRQAGLSEAGRPEWGRPAWARPPNEHTKKDTRTWPTTQRDATMGQQHWPSSGPSFINEKRF